MCPYVLPNTYEYAPCAVQRQRSVWSKSLMRRSGERERERGREREREGERARLVKVTDAQVCCSTVYLCSCHCCVCVCVCARLCVCVCVLCVCVCVCAYIYICTHTRTYTHTHTGARGGAVDDLVSRDVCGHVRPRRLRGPVRHRKRTHSTEREHILRTHTHWTCTSKEASLACKAESGGGEEG